MTRLIWNQPSERDYDAGVDRGVFYPSDGPGQVWNGLVSVEESPSEVDARPRYLDGVKVGNGSRRGEFAANVEAYTYPDAMGSDILRRSNRPRFGLSYRVHGPHGDKIHLVYNAIATPTAGSFKYQEASTFGWSLTTRGVELEPGIFVSHLVVDTSTAYPETIEAFENAIYGSEMNSSHLPSPADVLMIFEENSILQIIDHGDGTWTAIGPDDVVSMLDATTFQIDYPTAVYLNPWTYTVHSL